jgi:hypothetical protein
MANNGGYVYADRLFHEPVLNVWDDKPVQFIRCTFSDVVIPDRRGKQPFSYSSCVFNRCTFETGWNTILTVAASHANADPPKPERRGYEFL